VQRICRKVCSVVGVRARAWCLLIFDVGIHIACLVRVLMLLACGSGHCRAASVGAVVVIPVVVTVVMAVVIVGVILMMHVSVWLSAWSRLFIMVR
jgi:hypothetical protein